MIVGAVVSGRPMIQVLALLPRLAIVGNVNFLIDTGSDTSVIHPADADGLGIDFDRDFAGTTPVSSLGVSGLSIEYSEAAVLFLEHEDGEMDQIPIEIRVAWPSSANSNLPSLLGLDVLRRYRFVFEEQHGVVRLESPASEPA